MEELLNGQTITTKTLLTGQARIVTGLGSARGELLTVMTGRVVWSGDVDYDPMLV
jgi:hypothetical protein